MRFALLFVLVLSCAAVSCGSPCGSTRVSTDVEVLKGAVLRYGNHNGQLPASLEKLVEKGYVDVGCVPTDPWGRQYRYRLQDDFEFSLGTFGRDGRRGGRGPDADYVVVTKLSKGSRAAMQVMVLIEAAVLQYCEMMGSLPNSLDDLVGSGFLSASPKDFWGRAIHYEIQNDCRAQLKALGSDGRVGGTEEDADIVRLIFVPK